MPVLKRKVNGVWVDVSGISEHVHNISDILNFPTALPADGGNADTLDGKTADEFAAASDIEELRGLIENIPAAEQVQADWNQEDESAVDFIKNKPELITKEYVDTAVSNIAVEVDKTLTEENKAADAKAVGDAIKKVEENALNNGVAILAETQKSVDALAASIQYLTATDDGNGIITLDFAPLAPASEVAF